MNAGDGSGRIAMPRAFSMPLSTTFLLLACLVFFVGVALGFLAPSLRDAPPFVVSDLTAVAKAISGNPAAWRWANGLIAGAFVVAVIGFLQLAQAAERTGRPWANLGLLVFSIATSLQVLKRLILIGPITSAAQDYPSPMAIEIWVAFDSIPIGQITSLLAYIAIAASGYSVGLVTGHTTRFAFVGVAAFGIAVELLGFGIPAYVFLALAGLGFAAKPVQSPEVIVDGGSG